MKQTCQVNWLVRARDVKLNNTNIKNINQEGGSQKLSPSDYYIENGKYVFTEQRNEVTHITNLDVNTPMPTRPLSAFKKVDGDADSVVEGAIDGGGIEDGEDEPL